MKLRLMLISALLCLMLVSCAKEEKLSLPLSKYNDTTGIENIESVFNGIEDKSNSYNLLFTVTNKAENDICYGTRWLLEKYQDGGWYSIEMKADSKFEDYSLLLKSGETCDITISLFSSYETPLDAGKYRILQSVKDGTLVLEFSIEEE